MIRLLFVAVVVVVGAILALRVFWSRKGDPRRTKRNMEQRVDGLRRELLSLCHDERVADSLVEAEMLAHAQLGEVQCYQRAIKKLKYDRAR